MAWISTKIIYGRSLSSFQDFFECYVALIPKAKAIGLEYCVASRLNKSGFEIEFNAEKYIILPHSSILMLIRDEMLLE